MLNRWALYKTVPVSKLKTRLSTSKEKADRETLIEQPRTPFLVTHFRGRDRSVTLDVRKTPNLNGLACMDLSYTAFTKQKENLYISSRNPGVIGIG